MRNEKICKTCKHWKREEYDFTGIQNPKNPKEDYDELEDEDEIKSIFGYNVRKCCNENLLFYQRPAINGAAVVDGSDYMASIFTAEEFGCILHEV